MLQNPAHNRKFTMSGIQKINKYSKQHENPMHNQEKSQSIATDPETTQVVKEADKDVKTIPLSRFKRGENVNIMKKKMEDIKNT